MADDSWLPVCASEAVADGGVAQRFDVALDYGRRLFPGSAFVIRFEGRAVGWLNQCQHVPVELDWTPGRVFDASGRYLMCSVHGAMYRPDDGVCVAGPCSGARLRRIEIRETDGAIEWRPDALVKAPCHDGDPRSETPSSTAP